MKRPRRSTLLAAIAYPAWVVAAFYATQYLTATIAGVLISAGLPINSQSPVFETSFAAIVYVMTLVIAIGAPWLFLKQRTSRQELSLTRLLSWKDVGIAAVGFVGYLLLTAGLLALAQLIPGINLEEAQDVGFQQIGQRYELILAFLTLVIIAPIAEEILLRGYLLGKLRRRLPLWSAILIVSLLFAFLHGQVNVGIDTFALSVAMSLAVVWAKSLWPAILIHMLKNGIAFYLLFINPLF